jgi:hypothetical protein
MVYDFEWDGDTLAVGDGEGESLTLPTEPTGNQAGADTSGALETFTDFTHFGVYNGNFRKGPPDPSQNLDVSSSTSGSNFMPHWRFIQSSNTNITAKQVRDAASPSGSNLRFTFAAGAASDAAYIEQIVDIGGSRLQQLGDVLRGAGRLVAGANVAARLRMQYLTVDGSIAGMPAESTTSDFATGSSENWQWNYASLTPPAENAAKLRLRVEAYRTSGSSAATLDVVDIRRDIGRPFTVLPDFDGATRSGVLYNEGGKISALASQGGSIINFQLVPLTYVQNNIPAATTADMPLSDLGVPGFMAMPWAGSIVGVSYRMDGSISAGTLAIRATVGGVNVWTAHSLTSASPQDDVATQNIGTDQFVSGDLVGVDLVTNGAFLPTTRDIVVTLWLAVNFVGV